MCLEVTAKLRLAGPLTSSAMFKLVSCTVNVTRAVLNVHDVLSDMPGNAVL